MPTELAWYVPLKEAHCEDAHEVNTGAETIRYGLFRSRRSALPWIKIYASSG